MVHIFLLYNKDADFSLNEMKFGVPSIDEIETTVSQNIKYLKPK
jgi:hypothetical protein